LLPLYYIEEDTIVYLVLREIHRLIFILKQTFLRKININ